MTQALRLATALRISKVAHAQTDNFFSSVALTVLGVNIVLLCAPFTFLRACKFLKAPSSSRGRFVSDRRSMTSTRTGCSTNEPPAGLGRIGYIRACLRETVHRQCSVEIGACAVCIRQASQWNWKYLWRPPSHPAVNRGRPKHRRLQAFR